MSAAVTNFLFEAANFLVLAGALGWFLFKPVREALDKEQAQWTQQEQQAAEKRTQAEALLKDAEAKTAALGDELAATRAEKIAAAQREAADITESARREHNERLRELETQWASAQQARAEALADTLGQIASDAVRRLLDSVSGPDLELALVRIVCDRLPDHPPGPYVVECAEPLSDEALAMLHEKLGEFEARTVPDLGAGLRVTTAVGQIDSSGAAFAREAARQITANLRNADGAMVDA